MRVFFWARYYQYQRGSWTVVTIRVLPNRVFQNNFWALSINFYNRQRFTTVNTFIQVISNLLVRWSWSSWQIIHLLDIGLAIWPSISKMVQKKRLDRSYTIGQSIILFSSFTAVHKQHLIWFYYNFSLRLKSLVQLGNQIPSNVVVHVFGDLIKKEPVAEIQMLT